MLNNMQFRVTTPIRVGVGFFTSELVAVFKPKTGFLGRFDGLGELNFEWSELPLKKRFTRHFIAEKFKNEHNYDLA